MNTKETLKSKAERAAYEDARDCLYFGSGKCFWRDCGLSPERREAVWRKAVEDMKASSSIGDRCADYLRARRDYLIVGRSVKMAKTTLDIVAYDRAKDCIVFAVIVPHTQEEFTAEGHVMRNCIGGYYRRQADGSTFCFFIRKNGEPHADVEMSLNGRIKQCYTAGNKNVPLSTRRYANRMARYFAKQMKRAA